MKLAKALCLDIDGTVRRSKSGTTFIKDAYDIELIPGVEKIIMRYVEMDYLVLGVTNQAGVAHGFKLAVEIEQEMEATLELFKFSPFHLIRACLHDAKGKVEPYNHRSLCRKPDIGALAMMEEECFHMGYIIDWDNSLFVGDRPEDEECAKRAGIPFRHIDHFLTHPHEFKIGI